MILKKIKTEVCPHCGSEAILEQRRNFFPSDGSFTEVRMFDCGLELSCKSDRDDVDVFKKCPNSKEYKDMAVKRVKALDELFRFIDNIDVDSEFKCNIRTALNFKLNVD